MFDMQGKAEWMHDREQSPVWSRGWGNDITPGLIHVIIVTLYHPLPFFNTTPCFSCDHPYIKHFILLLISCSSIWTCKRTTRAAKLVKCEQLQSTVSEPGVNTVPQPLSVQLPWPPVEFELDKLCMCHYFTCTCCSEIPTYTYCIHENFILFNKMWRSVCVELHNFLNLHHYSLIVWGLLELDLLDLQLDFVQPLEHQWLVIVLTYPGRYWQLGRGMNWCRL